jgi:SpoVK/Ycf46/Vps4 family AAA+-type ATPase
MVLDPSTLAILLTRGDSGHWQIIYMILCTLALTLGKEVYEKIRNNFDKRKNKGWNQVKIESQEIYHTGWKYHNYPVPYLAICHFMNNNNIGNNMKHFVLSKNKKYNWNSIEKTDKINNYIIDVCREIKLTDDLYLDILQESVKTKENEPNSKNDSKIVSGLNFDMCIKSKVKSLEEIREFIDKVTKEYQEYLKSQSEKKYYHFVYTGNSAKFPEFNKSLINDFTFDNDHKQLCNESFDHIHNEHKNKILADIERLRNKEYFKKFGLKRKKGYLFYGPPGCGKTYTVMAIANHDKRHIIEIPMTRIKKNSELEDILGLTEIEDIPIEKHEIILMFDEIDTGGKAVEKRKEEDKGKSKESKEDINISKKDLIVNLLKSDELVNTTELDKLSLGTLLSRLDGIGNYDGIIIIGTTNCIEKLSPALYRDGRLELVKFDYCRKQDIQNIINEYFPNKLTEAQIENLPDVCNKIAPSTIIKYIQDYEYDFEGLIDKLMSIKLKNSIEPKI